MVTDRNHSSDVSSKQEVIRYIEKLAQIFRLNKQNAEVYSALSGENRALKKQLEDYHSQYNTLERRVKRLERDVKSLKIELEDLDECVDRETVVNLIHEIALSPNIKKWPKGAVYKGSSYLSESFEESDLIKRIVIRENKTIPHKQRRNARLRKVKIKIAVRSSGW